MKIDIIERIKQLPVTEETLSDAFAVLVGVEDRKSVDHYVKWVRSEARKIPSAAMYDLIGRTYLYAGQYEFDSFMIAMEWNREPNARFWIPRRKVLEGKHKIATQIQEFLDDPEARYLGFSQAPGTGKQLADNTPIMTRNGWKNHGDLVVGDEVIGMDGEFKRVTHVFPKTEQNCRVHFSNGEYIDCHENHEWVVYDRGRRKERILETKEIEKRVLEVGTPGKRGHRYILQLPLKEPMQGEYKELPVAPYTFGAWLGDGSTTNPYITGSPEDWCIIGRIEDDGYGISSMWVHKDTGCHTVSFEGLRQDLQQYGLCKSRVSVPKYIPEIYLTASLEQRLELLAGMIDTDGCKGEHGKYSYSTTNENIKDGFVELLATFGWRACVTVGEPHTSSSGITGRKPCYKIQFTNTIELPLVVERKKKPVIGSQRRIAITKIERIAPTIGNCIEVEGGIYLAGRTMLPTHNSTIIKFLLAYIIGKQPKSQNIYCSYSDGMVKMMLDSIRSMLTDTNEYRFNEIFPGLGEPDISSEYKTISYRKKGDFSTLGLISLGGSVTGRTRSNNVLITDDLVANKEMARSPERLEKLYDDYKATLTTRMIGDTTKQIQLGTRWSIHDPIGRMQSEHEGDPRYKFIAIPVEDENGESNFEYEHPDKYTREKIAEIKKSLDPVDFSCLFMQRGIEKEGLAFPSDSLKYYNGVLPDCEPDMKAFVVDVAWGGSDSLSMPICYVYGEDGYIVDWLFDKRDKSATMPRMIGKILHHKPHKGQFESNNGGREYADEIDRQLRTEHGYRCNISSQKAPNNVSKMARIEQYAPDIKNLYFLAEQFRDDDYRKAMNELTSLSYTTKNLHDDSPDSLAQLVAYLFGNTSKAVKAFKRPF